MANQQWLFVAAAKGIQSYVLRSDPLKEMVGGSELVERLPRADSFLGQVIGCLQIPADSFQVLSDSAGGVRILFGDKESARQLARLWPMLAAQYAPGLEMAVALVPVENDLARTIGEAERQIGFSRQQPAPAAPEAGPWVARNRRTGLPAHTLAPALHPEERRPEAVDLESARKRMAAAESSQQTLLDKLVPSGEAFAPFRPNDSAFNRRLWPLDLTKLTTDDNNYIAIIHADANRLGAVVMQCLRELAGSADVEKTAFSYRQLCAAIRTASEEAARQAMEPILCEVAEAIQRKVEGAVVPVRPLVCAGEDFTCVIQARHATRFVQHYLEALQQQSAERFQALKIPGLQPLTGCAGVVFCKSHYPFSRAYAVAESLCSFAKKATEREASAVAFLRMKYSLPISDDCEEIVEHGYQVCVGGEKVRLTMNPYLVGQPVGEQGATDLPQLAGLLDLVAALDHRSLPRSGLRELVTRAYQGKDAADHAFERLRLVVSERERHAAEHDRAWPSLEAALAALTRTSDRLWKESGDHLVTPLYDALELLHLAR